MCKCTLGLDFVGTIAVVGEKWRVRDPIAPYSYASLIGRLV